MTITKWINDNKLPLMISLFMITFGLPRRLARFGKSLVILIQLCSRIFSCLTKKVDLVSLETLVTAKALYMLFVKSPMSGRILTEQYNSSKKIELICLTQFGHP